MRRAVAVAGVLAAMVVGPAGTQPAGASHLAAAGVHAPAASDTVPGPTTAPEYWFARWRVPQLWASGARGQGVVIAEVDTGVTASLPELTGRVLPGKDFGVGGDGHVDREINAFGHGTAMASIMVGRRGLLGITGIAPGAKILPVAVPLDGTTDSRRPDRLADAITWSADHGADIINLSIGGKQYPGHDAVPCPPAEQNAVFHALSAGAVVVAAVGNTGPTANTVEDPGSCLGVVSVGAVNRRGDVASFSSRQPYLTVVAPGVNIPSLGRDAGDAFAGDGTSQASALVSASLALAKSAHPALSNRQLVARLLATLDDRVSTPELESGYGELDAGAMVRANVPADAANPVFARADPFLRRYVALRTSTDTTNDAAPQRSVARASPSVADRSDRAGDEIRNGLALLAAGLILLVGLGGALRRSGARRAGLSARPPAGAPPG